MRKLPRFKITGTHPAGVRIGNKDYVGTLHDVSCGGFKMHCTVFPSDAKPDMVAIGEIWVDDQMFQSPGRISHILKDGDQFFVGFAFDCDLAMINPAFSAFLKTLGDESQTSKMEVLAQDDINVDVNIIGELRWKLIREVTQLGRVKRIRKIDLSRCTNADSTGIAFSSIYLERGIPIVGCMGDVRNVLRVAGLCDKCPTVCDPSAGHAKGC